MNRAVKDMIMRRRRDEAMDGHYGMDERDRAYDRAYDKAYDRAYDRAYDKAYDKAYREGYDRGYDEAHNMMTPYGEHGMTVDDDYDGRRGVRGTGRYGMGGSMYRGRRDRAAEEELTLTPADIKKWKMGLSMGERFTLPQVEQAMRTMGIQPRDYTLEDLHIMANALYSDYSPTLSRIIPKEKETNYYTSLAKDFLEDKDASVKGSEKAATYFYCMVDNE